MTAACELTQMVSPSAMIQTHLRLRVSVCFTVSMHGCICTHMLTHASLSVMLRTMSRTSSPPSSADAHTCQSFALRPTSLRHTKRYCLGAVSDHVGYRPKQNQRADS